MKNKLFSPARKEAGFTLIELLTVIVIIGILAAIAIPVFTSQRARAQDSQTISDVRNIAVQAETIMSDPKSTYDDVTKTNIDFASSKNVSWNISGKASLGGYCIVAKNTAGKKYTTDATALTYDSLAGGVGQSGKACDQTVNPVVPSGSTGVGSLVSVAVAAPTSVTASRNSQTSATVNWTIPTDATVTGYVVQRSATTNDTDFVTVGTITSRTTSTFTDTSAPSTAAYYRLMSTTADGTSSVKSNNASLGAYVAFTSVTFNTTSSGATGTVQSFTVPENGTYTIDAYGAGGGNSYNGGLRGGYGAGVTGTKFTLTAGQSVNIVVGQAGSSENTWNGSSGFGAGGGGGTFVYVNNTTPLIIAGGGGGANSWTNTIGFDANGIGGSGQPGTNDSNTAGGAGWLGSATDTVSYAKGGKSFSGSWSGGVNGWCNHTVANGGFGGGATAGCSGGGAGGGYTGGSNNTSNGGLPGTSFVASTATSTPTYGLNSAKAGKVVITRVN